jgi:hypothetical protein
MPQSETGRFTVGVFKDVASAGAGIEALRRRGFAPESLTIIAKDSPEAAELIQRVVGEPGTRQAIAPGSAWIAHGPLVEALGGSGHDLTGVRLAAAMKRVGFQIHDGQIFESLTERGGILVGVKSAPRAADALATLHCYGGGNAAIGAWGGRLSLD